MPEFEPMDDDDFLDPEIIEFIGSLTDEALSEVLDGMPEAVVDAILARIPANKNAIPADPGEQAEQLDQKYVRRPHLDYLAKRLAVALDDVTAGKNRFIAVSMPPRTGKSLLISIYLLVWLLRRDPTLKIGLVSNSTQLATSWGRQVRRLIERNSNTLGVRLAPDAGAVSDWQTAQEGEVHSRSMGTPITGVGFRVLIVDDIVKDSASAHSATVRDAVWSWWTGTAFTRLEPPSLAIAVGTRWHEDDFIGRLLSHEYEGDPNEWEVISFPAIAEKPKDGEPEDVLGRAEGAPLLSPLVPEETEEEAISRWSSIRTAVGEYNWAAQYQQRPAPAKGAIFDMDKFRYWTRDPEKAFTTDAENNRVPEPNIIYLEPDLVTNGTWVDSWDATFKATDDSDYVVGQRWVKIGANRFLVAQQRGRWTFTHTIERMLAWGRHDDPIGSPYGKHVHVRLIEDKANGPAIIDTLRDHVAGIKPVTPTTSKEARARSITPEIESGNVYLPHPTDAGNEWVRTLISELRNFPHDAHDDQVDGLTQALSHLRDPGIAGISIPGQPSGQRSLTPLNLRITATRASAASSGRAMAPKRDPRVEALRRAYGEHRDTTKPGSPS